MFSLNVIAYLLYLSLSIGLTIWVANVLFKNGRVFMDDIFKGNKELSGAINKLLLVGFYLINFGYVLFALKTTTYIETGGELIELLSKKVGFIVIILGLMHFMNMFVLYKMRKRAKTNAVQHYAPRTFEAKD